MLKNVIKVYHLRFLCLYLHRGKVIIKGFPRWSHFIEVVLYIYIIFITVFKIRHKLHLTSGSRHYSQKLWVYAISMLFNSLLTLFNSSPEVS